MAKIPVKTLLTDVAGVFLIILAALLGWLPGPGGIPLLIAGLGLLAVNHTWAKKLLIQLKQKGINISELIFREHPLWRLFIDVLSLVFLAIGIYIFNSEFHSLIKAVAISLILVAFSLLAGNRQRLSKILAYFKAKA